MLTAWFLVGRYELWWDGDTRKEHSHQSVLFTGLFHLPPPTSADTSDFVGNVFRERGTGRVEIRRYALWLSYTASG